MKQTKRIKRLIRHRRVRAKITGTKDRPRICVSRSNRYMSAQIIDDSTGKTLASTHDIPASKDNKRLKVKGNKSERAKEVGVNLAEAAKKLGIKKVVFDKGGHKYHGRVKELAEGLRSGGLEF
ncbi:MAG: 50S ribosomal protein L18 [Parcubacteria group bacterium]